MTSEQEALQRWNDAEQAHAAAVQRYVIHWWDGAPPADWEPVEELTVVGLAGITRLRSEADRARADFENLLTRGKIG
jgi:hypothetical protein